MNLGSSESWLPALRWVLLIAGLLISGVIAWGTKFVVVVIAMALFAGFGGTAAYAVSTVSVAHGGSIPISGPTTGDQEAAERVELTLPETGVCGGSGVFDQPAEQTGGCCAPADAVTLELSAPR